MIVILLFAVLIFLLLVWLTEEVVVEYYVIHLKEEISRLENIKQMEQLLGKKITIFDAHGPCDIPGPCSRGHCGAYKSHKGVLELVHAKKSSKYSVIFEDDFIVTSELHKQVNDIINKLEDFDVVILGNFEANHGQHVKDNIYRLDPNRLCTGTHAYLVKNENVPNITERLKYKTNFDLELPDIIHQYNLNAFVIWPRIAFHNHSFPSATE